MGLHIRILAASLLIGLTFGQKQSIDQNNNQVYLDKQDENVKIYRYDWNFSEWDLVDNQKMIIFRDADSLEANQNVDIQMFDKNLLFHHKCSRQLWPDTEYSAFVCDIYFSRSGRLNKTRYCFKLKAFDTSIKKKAHAVSNVCVYAAKPTERPSTQDSTTTETIVANATEAIVTNATEAIVTNATEAHEITSPEVTVSKWPHMTLEVRCGMICMPILFGFSSLIVLLVLWILLFSLRKYLKTEEYKMTSTCESTFTRPQTKFEVKNELLNQSGFSDFHLRHWESIDMNEITVGNVIGEGEFGKVILAKLNSPDGETVVMKTVKDINNTSEVTSLKKEFEQLQKVSVHPHPNVIRLVGCSSTGDIPFIFLEFCVFESLKEYLMASRLMRTRTGSEGIDKVSTEDIISFSLQIANGMSHLAKMKLVHRDLAARNVMLSEGKVCKISDFGLTRNVCNSCDVYSKSSNDKVPVKWMAPESLSLDEEYTTKSDVWSFGILGYELVMLGGSPYPELIASTHAEFLNLLISGNRMKCPSNCSQQLFAVFDSCWALEPALRPTFDELAMKFSEFQSSPNSQLWTSPTFSEKEMQNFDYSFYRNYIQRVQRARFVSKKSIQQRMSFSGRSNSSKEIMKSKSESSAFSPSKKAKKTLQLSQSLCHVNNSSYDSTFDLLKSIQMRQELNERAHTFSYLPMNQSMSTLSASLDANHTRNSLATTLSTIPSSYILMSEMLTSTPSSASTVEMLSTTSISSKDEC